MNSRDDDDDDDDGGGGGGGDDGDNVNPGIMKSHPWLEGPEGLNPSLTPPKHPQFKKKTLGLGIDMKGL